MNPTAVTILYRSVLLGIVLQSVVSGVQGGQFYNYTCQPHNICDIADDIITAIISDPDNYQRLMKVFHPFNHAVPQFVTFLFFTNGTPISQPVCNHIPYVGITTELNGIENIYSTMWYSSSTYLLSSGAILNEFALMVPQIISGVFFKTNLIITDYPFACLTVPFQIPPSNSLKLSVTLSVSILMFRNNPSSEYKNIVICIPHMYICNNNYSLMLCMGSLYN